MVLGMDCFTVSGERSRRMPDATPAPTAMVLAARASRG